MKVKFPDVEADCEPDKSIFSLAQEIGVKIPTACAGNGSCGQCRIKIVSGEECLNPLTKAEVFHTGNAYFVSRIRLSCQCKFIKDGTVVVEVK